MHMHGWNGLRRRHLSGQRGERGSVLVITLFALLIITLVNNGYLQISVDSQRYSTLIQDFEQTLYNAESGIQRAKGYIISQQGEFTSAQVNAPDWVPPEYQISGYLLANEGIPDLDDQVSGAEVFVVELEPDVYYILSRNEFRQTERILKEIMFAAFSAADRFFSDAVVADYDGGIQTAGNVTINGDTRLLSTLPPVVEPASYDFDNSGQTLSSTITLSDTNGDPDTATTYLYDAIDLTGNKEIIIDGDVQLFVSGDMELSGSAELGRCADAMDISDSGNCSLVIYIIGSGSVTIDVSVGGTAEIRGAIYAPESAIEIASSGTPEIYGVLVGFGVDLQGDVTVTHDTNLTARLEEIGLTGIDFDADLQRISWKEL
ncbi:MAG: hypothetical protein ACE5JP_08055 [Candidatus Bipolaricaulia bacterium]